MKGLNRPQDEGRTVPIRELDELRRHGFDLTRIEPFVSARVVALYLGIDPAMVVRYAKAGKIPAHTLPESGKRIHWRFLLSEVRESMLARTGPKRCSNVRD